MFVWRVDKIMEEFGRQMPLLKGKLDDIITAWGTASQNEVLKNAWTGLKNETIDYGIMENARHVVLLPASGLEWSDVGSWDSLFDVLLPDENGNIVFCGQHLGIDTQKSLIYGHREGKLIVTIGVEDLIIVDAGDVLLVCKKESAQLVRQAVMNLNSSDQKRYL
jgi:mannose-1-phosphate guanylyltransferase